MRHVESNRKNGTAGKAIWHPLPSSIIDVIFDKNIAPKLLGSFYSGNGSVGEWDQINGIYLHHKSGLYFVLAATQNGIERCVNFIKEHGSPESLRLKTSGVSPKEIDSQMASYASSLGNYISLVHPFEYNPLNFYELLSRHFGENAGWSFLQEGSLDFPGTIRVKSVPNTLSSLDIPVSHSSQIGSNISEARSQDFQKAFSFKEEMTILDSMFNNKTDTKYVSDVKPSAGHHSLERNIENINGEIEFVNNADIKCAPVARIGNDSFVNTASFIQDGSIKKATLEGPYIRNANPAYPSSHFYPHPDWVTSLFVFPKSIIRDPQTASAIITIALLTSAGQKHTQYNYIYNKTTTIIDNDSIEKSLFK
jgi:hypothetical protein